MRIQWNPSKPDTIGTCHYREAFILKSGSRAHVSDLRAHVLAELVAYSMLAGYSHSQAEVEMASQFVSSDVAGNPIIRERPPHELDTTARTNRDS